MYHAELALHSRFYESNFKWDAVGYFEVPKGSKTMTSDSHAGAGADACDKGSWESECSEMEHWNGMVEWTTGME